MKSSMKTAVAKSRYLEAVAVCVVVGALLVSPLASAQRLLISNFSKEGLAAVYRDGKWGFVNAAGKWVVEPQYDEVCPFQEARAAVKIGASYGYFNEKGVLVLRPSQGTRANFDQKTKWVSVVENRWGFINEKGEFVLKPTFDEAGSFHEGKAVARVGRLWGFIGEDGRWAIAPQFDDVGHFFEGKARAKKNNRWGYIDAKGAWLLQPQFEWAGRFSDGLAVVSRNEKYGYINEQGDVVIPFQFTDARRFVEGVAPVAKEHDVWGLIDHEGRFVVPAGFAAIGYPREGKMPVRQGKQWFFANAKGENLSAQGFEEVSGFYEKRAVARFQGKVGYLDSKLQWAIAPQFEVANDFVEGRATALKDKKWHIIDPTGHTLFQFDFINLRLPFSC